MKILVQQNPNNPFANPSAEAQSSCDPTITRKQFIAKTIKRATVAGALLTGCKVADKFLVPPAYAQASPGCVQIGPITFCGGPITD